MSIGIALRRFADWSNNRLFAAIVGGIALAVLLGLVTAVGSFIARVPSHAQALALATHVSEDDRQHALDTIERATIKSHLAALTAEMCEVRAKVDQVPEMKGKVDTMLLMMQDGRWRKSPLMLPPSAPNPACIEQTNARLRVSAERAAAAAVD